MISAHRDRLGEIGATGRRAAVEIPLARPVHPEHIRAVILPNQDVAAGNAVEGSGGAGGAVVVDDDPRGTAGGGGGDKKATDAGGAIVNGAGGGGGDKKATDAGGAIVNGQHT